MIRRPTASRMRRVRGRAALTSSASRRCSLRSMAITAPNITIQRNMKEAISSAAVIGEPST